jgi:hypothetical protein
MADFWRIAAKSDGMLASKRIGEGDVEVKEKSVGWSVILEDTSNFSTGYDERQRERRVAWKTYFNKYRKVESLSHLLLLLSSSSFFFFFVVLLLLLATNFSQLFQNEKRELE